MFFSEKLKRENGYLKNQNDILLDKVEQLEKKLKRNEEALEKVEERRENEIERLEELQEQALADADWEHQLALKKKAYEIEELPVVKNIRAENEVLTRQAEVLRKELQMTEKVVDLNADIIEIKELFNTLITKLPEVKISSLAVSNNGNCK